MKFSWVNPLAVGVSVCALTAHFSLYPLPASAAPLVIPGLGPEDLVPPAAPVYAPAAPVQAPVIVASAQEPMASNGNLGGGFLELLMTGRDPSRRVIPQMQGQPTARYNQPMRQNRVAMNMAPAVSAVQKTMEPQFLRQEVEYRGPHAPGTIVIDTPNKFLFLVERDGRALRYGIGVGRPGFEWSGVKTISRKAEWPDWTPPPEMLKRRPDLPTHMVGGPENPLGARAMYLGSTMYRIHGTNEPDTIGTNVSSGCIRMMNEDVTDLYERVRIGTKVIVM